MTTSAPTHEHAGTGVEAVTRAEERGHTHIRDNVVERIATVAVGEVAGVVNARRDILGMGLGRREVARVQAATRGNQVICAVEISLTYPTPIRQTAAAIQSSVSNRVHILTGLRVGAVDVSVTGLIADTQPRVQ